MASTQVSSVDMKKKFDENVDHVLRYCCSATESLKEHEAEWQAKIRSLFDEWVSECGMTWVSYTDGWTAFASSQDLTVLIKLPCGCNPRGTCTKCGPVRGRISGTVYLRRLKPDEDKYFFPGGEETKTQL